MTKAGPASLLLRVIIISRESSLKPKEPFKDVQKPNILVSIDGPMSSAKTVIGSGVRAKQQSEPNQIISFERDQARIELEGRREVARIIRSIKPKEIAANEAGLHTGLSRDISLGEEQLRWIYHAENNCWLERTSDRPDGPEKTITSESGKTSTSAGAAASPHTDGADQANVDYKSRTQPGRPIPTMFAMRGAHTRAKPFVSGRFSNLRSQSAPARDARIEAFYRVLGSSTSPHIDSYPNARSAQMPHSDVGLSQGQHVTNGETSNLPRQSYPLPNSLFQILQERSSTQPNIPIFNDGTYYNVPVMSASALKSSSISLNQPILQSAAAEITLSRLTAEIDQLKQVVMSNWAVMQANTFNPQGVQFLNEQQDISAHKFPLGNDPGRTSQSVMQTHVGSMASFVSAQSYSQRLYQNISAVPVTSSVRTSPSWASSDGPRLEQSISSPEDDPAVIHTLRHKSAPSLSTLSPPSAASLSDGMPLPVSRGIWPNSKFVTQSHKQTQTKRTQSKTGTGKTIFKHPLPQRPAPSVISPRLLGVIPCNGSLTSSGITLKDEIQLQEETSSASVESFVDDDARKIRSNAPTPEAIDIVNRTQPIDSVSDTASGTLLPNARPGKHSVSVPHREVKSRVQQPIWAKTNAKKDSQTPHISPTASHSRSRKALSVLRKSLAQPSKTHLQNTKERQQPPVVNKIDEGQRKWKAFVQEMGGVLM